VVLSFTYPPFFPFCLCEGQTFIQEQKTEFRAMRNLEWIMWTMMMMGWGRAVKMLNNDAMDPWLFQLTTETLPVVLDCPHLPFFDRLQFGNTQLTVTGILPSICPFKYDPQALATYQSFMGGDMSTWARCNESVSELFDQSPLWRQHRVFLFAETYICGTVNTSEPEWSRCNPVSRGVYHTNGTFVLQGSPVCMTRMAEVTRTEPPHAAMPKKKGSPGGERSENPSDAQGTPSLGKVMYEICIGRFVHPSGHTLELYNVDTFRENYPAFLKRAMERAERNITAMPRFLFRPEFRNHTPQFEMISSIPLQLFYPLPRLRELEREFTPHWKAFLKKFNDGVKDPSERIAIPNGDVTLAGCNAVSNSLQRRLMDLQKMMHLYPAEATPSEAEGTPSTDPAQRELEASIKRMREMSAKLSEADLQLQADWFMKQGKPLDGKGQTPVRISKDKKPKDPSAPPMSAEWFQNRLQQSADMLEQVDQVMARLQNEHMATRDRATTFVPAASDEMPHVALPHESAVRPDTASAVPIPKKASPPLRTEL
jgi:hypothetical protein